MVKNPLFPLRIIDAFYENWTGAIKPQDITVEEFKIVDADSEQKQDSPVQLKSASAGNKIVVVVIKFTFKDTTGKNQPVLLDFPKEVTSVIERIVFNEFEKIYTLS